MVIDTKLSEGPWQVWDIGWPEPLEVQQRQMLSPEYGEEYVGIYICWYRLGTDCLGNNLTKKDEGADKVITSQPCIPRPTAFWDVLASVEQAGLGKWSFLSAQCWWDHSWSTVSSLCSKYKANMDTPESSNMVMGWSIQCMRRSWGNWDLSAWRSLGGDIIAVYKYLVRRNSEDRPKPLPDKYSENTTGIRHHECGETLEQATEGDYWFSLEIFRMNSAEQDLE